MVNDRHDITVRLMGKAAEVLARQGLSGASELTQEIEISVKERTIRGVLQELARQNPLIADQIVREDGTPRSSTRILVGGRPPGSLDDPLPFPDGDTGSGGRETASPMAKKPKPKPKPHPPIVIIIVVPCDG